MQENDVIRLEVCDLVDKDLMNVQCSICTFLLQEAVQLNNGCPHVFCQECLRGHITSCTENKWNLGCPDCRKPFEAKHVSLIEPLNHRIRNLQVKCPVCKKRRQAVHEFPGHLKVCPKHPVACRWNCGRLFPKKELEGHHNICPKKKLSCHRCPFQAVETEMKLHKCPLKKVRCSQCKERFERRLTTYHNRFLCVKSRVRCRFCHTEIIRPEMRSHVATCQNSLVCPDCFVLLSLTDVSKHVCAQQDKGTESKYQIEFPPGSGCFHKCTILQIEGQRVQVKAGCFTSQEWIDRSFVQQVPPAQGH